MGGRHSTQRRAGAAFALALASGAYAADSTWLDVEGRIQYAYYTEDRRALANLTQELAKGEDANALRDYYGGLAYYRLALLGVESGAEGCVLSIDRALTQQRDFVEALALQAACLDLLGKTKPLRAPLAEKRSRAHIAKAVRLAPRNPRVLLIQAIGAKAGPSEKELRRAVVAFEAERQGVDQVPGWGAADAYLQLGKYELERKNVLAARDAVERALLIAPEFAAARRLRARITSGG